MPYNQYRLTRTTPSQLRGIQESYYYESDDETLSEIMAAGYFAGFPCESGCETVMTVNASDGWANIKPDGDGGASLSVDFMVGDKTAQQVSDGVNLAFGSIESSRVAYLGDSITNVYGVTSVGSKEFHAHTSNDPRVTYCGKFGEPGMGFFAAGVTTGKTLDDALDDLYAANTQPQIVSVLLGTNDLGLATFEEIINAYKELIATLQSRGYSVIISELTPRNDLAVGSDSRLMLHKLNVWINRYAAIKSIRCNHFYSACVEADGSGNWRSGFNSDSVHPSMTGAIAMGGVVVSTLFNYSYVPYLAMDNDDATGLQNPCMIDDVRTSGASAETAGDGIPDYFGKANAPSANFTHSLVGGSDVYGNWFKQVRDTTSDTSIFRSHKISASVGDIIQIGCRVKNTIADSNGSDIAVSASTSGGTSWVSAGTGTLASLVSQSDGAYDLDATFLSEAEVTEDGTVGIHIDLQTRDGGGTGGDIYFGQITLRNLTTLGVV